MTSLTTAPVGLVPLDALGPGGPFTTRRRMPVENLGGMPVAELSLVPTLYVTRSMSAMRKAAAPSAEDRITALAQAGRLFVSGTVAGLPAVRYQQLVTEVSGMPISVVRAAAGAIARAAEHAYDSAQQGRPRGAVVGWRDPLTHAGRGVWTRRGDVLAVHAPGNHPGVHALWLEALALGYRVAVRPSRKEPFTPHRLVSALLATGFGADQVMLLPTDHTGANEILRGADLAMVYGGDEVIAKYAHDSRVVPQGPGRSKILVTADQEWRQHLDVIVESISSEGGTGCINTTAVLVEGDPTPLAQAIAERLAAIPSLPAQDERALLPSQPLPSARAIEAHLLGRATGTRPLLGGAGIVDELPGGGAVLRPAVHQVPEADAAQIDIELPFPCVWIAPWSTSAGVRPLRNSLVVTAITGETRLLDELLAEPTIGNAYVGDHPTSWLAPGVPHDSYLSDFLMRSKTVIRD